MIRAWKPDRGRQGGPQMRFLDDLRDVYEVLNAGSVGSGKTDCGIMAPVWYREYRTNPAFAALVLRHDEKDLHKHIMSLVNRPGYYDRYAGGSLNTTLMQWTMRTGAKVIFAHAKRLSALHGPEFAYTWWDELTHWSAAGAGPLSYLPPPEYLFVNFTRVRSAAGLRCRVRAGTNAYGPGKRWVRWRFGPWLMGAAYLKPPDEAPPAIHAAAESLRRLIEAGVLPEPREGQPLVPSGVPLYWHPNADGTETWEAPPRDEDDARQRELLSRSCLLTRTGDNAVLSAGDPQYELRVRAAGALLSAQLAGNDWDAEEPDEGFFRRESFEIVPRDRVPRLAGIVARWDFAWSRYERRTKDSDRSPWTVRVLLGWTPRDAAGGRDWYVLHVVREQGDPNRIMPLVKQTAQADARAWGFGIPILAPVDFSAGKVVISDLRNLLEGFRVVEQREAGEKHVRIATLQSPAEARRIKLVAGEWNHALLDEAARYPKRPNDQLDALAGAYLHVIETEGGIPTAEEIERGMAALAPLAAQLGDDAAPAERPRSAAEIFRAQHGGDPMADAWDVDDYGVPG